MNIINSFCFEPSVAFSNPKLWISSIHASSMTFDEDGSHLVSISNRGSGSQDELAGDFGGTIDPPSYSNNIIVFDGSRQALVAPGAGGQGTGNFSVALVLNSGSSSTATIIDKGNTVWSIQCDSGGKLAFSVSDGSTTDTGNTNSTIWDGNNHLVMLVHDATEGSYALSIDNTAATGSPYASTYTGTLAANQGNLTLAANPGLTQFWNGSLMSIMVWERALSGQEQTAVYNWAQDFWTLGSGGEGGEGGG